MPQISLLKTIENFFTGVKKIPNNIMQKRAERRAMLQGRYKACDDLLFSIQPIIDKIPQAKQLELQKELDLLEKEFTYLCKHFKSTTPELDKRLEIVILQARTLKILAACLSIFDDPSFATQKQDIQDILYAIDTLKQTTLHYETINSGIMAEYKQQLNNLEVKTTTHVDSTGISFKMSE